MELETLTVKELKEKLKNVPDDYEVVIFCKSIFDDNPTINVNKTSGTVEIFCK